MSLLFVDGATHYATNDMLDKWGSFDAGLTIVETNPRRAGSKSIYSNNTPWTVRTPPFDAVETYVVVGCAVRLQPYLSIELRIGTEVQVRLNYMTDVLKVQRGAGVADLASMNTEGVLVIGEWYYFEFASLIADSGGTIEVRLNGVPLTALTLTGLDTKNSASAGCDRVAFNPGVAGQITDIYVDDTSFHGDCIVETLYPVGSGSHTVWTPSAGQNWENVDDPSDIDDDATYNSSGQQGAMDTFLHAPIPSRPSSVVKALAVHFTARKDWAGSRVMKPMLRVGSTDYVHAGDGLILSDVYHGQQRMWETNPGGGAWSESTINTAQIGYDLVTAT